jgi:hypothetical protein
LSNGQLTLNVRNDNGAIDNAILNGKDFFDYGTHVSDWGMQNGTNTGSFVLNNTSGGTSQPVTVTSTATSVTVTGTYTAGGSNVSFSRVYRLVAGVNALTIVSNFTNNAATTMEMRYFDTFDPDQGGGIGLGTNTVNDVLVSGGIRVARASATNDLTFTIGSIYGETSILDCGGPFQINSGSILNTVVTSPVDGDSTTADLGAHMVYVRSIAPGQTVETNGVLAFGETNLVAIDHFVIAASTTGPGVSTNAPTLVTTTGATLNGSANPYNQSTTAFFVYGTDPTLLTGTTTTSTQSLGSGSTLVPFSQVLTGLTPGTTYYYRASGTNVFGTNIGSILSFSTGPEIAVEQPLLTNLVDGTASVSFPDALVATTTPVKTFTIKNSGSLDLTGLSITKDGANSADFTIVGPVSTTVVGGGSTTFTVSFTPGALGARTAALHIASNDVDENPFDINLTGNGVATLPQPAYTYGVMGSSTMGYNGLTFGTIFTAVSASTVTHLGAYDHGQDGLNASMPVGIWNAAGTLLSSTTVTTSDTLVGFFRYSMLAAPVALVAGQQYYIGALVSNNADALGVSPASFIVDPRITFVTSVYTSTGVLSMPTTNLGASPQYIASNFLLGSGDPEIVVEQPVGTNLTDGSASVAFGTTDVAASLSQTFTIKNTGTGALSIGAITFDGTNPGDFSVTGAPAVSVAAAGSTTLTVRFAPLGAGARSAVMHIVNGDADETPFDITVTGTGLAPEIVVHNGSHSLAPELSDGQVTVVNFGSTAPNVASVRNFLVRNTGDADLDITTITVPAGYNTNGAAVTLAPGTSYSFQVALEIATPATYAGSVVINSDDLNEAAFDFPVTGTVVAPGSAPVVNVGGEVAVTGTTGSTVLGGPVGSTLYSFIGSSPALNSSGVVASAVQIRHADASLHSGMMVGQPLVLIYSDSQAAPSLPGVTHFSFGPPVINEAGHIAFIGEVRGAGITANVNSRCLFSNASDGTLKLVARMGTDVGLGSNLKALGNFSIGGDLVIFLGTLVDNRSVLFGWDASSGLRPLVRTGQSLSANGANKIVKSFSILATANASSGHGKELSVALTGESVVTYSVVFTDGTSGVLVGSFDGTSDTGFGLTYGTSQQLADTYATAPGVIPLAKWGSFRSPSFDNTGSYYGFISQMVDNTLAGVGITNNVGVFVDTAPGLLTLQLRENDAAPGTTAGVVFSDFSDLVLGGGDYEFLVKGELRGTGVIVNVNNVGLWAQHATNGLELVAREGSEAPGVAGSTFLRLNQIALPGTAQPLFQATMTTGVGGVTTANDTGLWVINESGAVKLAVREGDTLSVDGTPRVVTAITALLNGTTTGGALGRRVFLQDGQMTLLLTFSGGIQAHAKVVVP